MISMAQTRPRPTAGVADDIERIEREDDARGYEPADDLAAFRALVRHLAADGDRRARSAGRRARRTLQEMAPGYRRPPLLTLTPAATSGQCSQCGHRFEDWNGGVCDGCR